MWSSAATISSVNHITPLVDTSTTFLDIEVSISRFLNVDANMKAALIAMALQLGTEKILP